MKKNHIFSAVILLLVTLVPVIVFLYFKENNNFANSSAPKPIWPIGVDENGKDSIYFKIPEFGALNCDSTLITTKEMDGKISIINLFFTKCQSICPTMNHQIDRVYKGLAQNNNLNIFSYSIDEERDNLGVLKAYSRNYDADITKWHFLRAPQDSIFSFGRNGLKLPVDAEDTEGDFLHSERVVLVDWNRNIRGYYMGTDSLEMNKMMNHIVLLLSEKDLIDKKQKGNYVK